MDSQNLDKTEVKSFRIPAQKYGNGSYLIIFILLSAIYTNYESGIQHNSLSALMAFFTTGIRIVLDTGVLYFLTLWIMDVIRRRGKIERPENKKAKKIVNIVFGILFLLMMGSIAVIALKPSSVKVSPEQTSFTNTLLEKFKDFSGESDGVKIAMQSFLDVVNKKEYSKMHESLKNLLSATQTLQPKIDELKIFSQQGVNLSNNEKEQSVFNLYLKAIDLRDQDNKKVSEMATFGLTVDWGNPTEAQIAKWTQLASELGIIETEIQSTQAEFQKIP